MFIPDERRHRMRQLISNFRSQLSHMNGRRKSHIITGLIAEEFSGSSQCSNDDVVSSSFIPDETESEILAQLDVADLDAALDACTPSSTLSSLVGREGLGTPLDESQDKLEISDFYHDGPFRFLDLPPEIQQLIYRLYFPSPEMIVVVKRRTPNDEAIIHNPWEACIPLLQVCKEIYRTAKPYFYVQETILDLSQYVSTPLYPVPIATYYSSINSAQIPCTNLIMTQDSWYRSADLPTMQNLRKISILDFQSWRNLVPAANLTQMVMDFEKGAACLLEEAAAAMLQFNAENVPDTVAIEVTFVCDLLVCVNANRFTPKQDKLRHLIKFTSEHRNGQLLSRTWLSRDSQLGPLPLHQTIAPHIHEYCLHLRDCGGMPAR